MSNLIRIYLSFADENGKFINKSYDLTPDEFYKLNSAVDSFVIKRLGVFINKGTIKGSESVLEAELRREIGLAKKEMIRYNENSGNLKPIESFLSVNGQSLLAQKKELENKKLS